MELGDVLAEGQAWFNLGIVADGVDRKDLARRAYMRSRAAALRLGDQESVFEIDVRLSRLEE